MGGGGLFEFYKMSMLQVDIDICFSPNNICAQCMCVLHILCCCCFFWGGGCELLTPTSTPSFCHANASPVSRSFRLRQRPLMRHTNWAPNIPNIVFLGVSFLGDPQNRMASVLFGGFPPKRRATHLAPQLKLTAPSGFLLRWIHFP